MWNKNKKLHSKALIASQLFLVIISVLTTDQLTLARAPKQLSIPMNQTGGSCPQSIALYDGLRLTFQFPSKVRVAVPSHDQMIDIFISGRLIVINPSAERRSDRNQVTLTTELDSHQAFICQFELFAQSELREQNQPFELVRIQDQNAQEAVESKALNLLGAYIRESLNRRSDSVADSVSKNIQNKKTTQPEEIISKKGIKLIKSWQQKLAQHSIQGLLQASDFKVSSLPPLRAQDHLIYVVIERVIRSQQRLFLRIKLLNRSQNLFELDQIYSESSSQALPSILWSTDNQEQLLKKIQLQAGEKAQYMSLTAPLDLLQSVRLSFASLDGRVVTVDMSSFNEF
ncbi:MAG: hypothetical protein CMH49_06870 [Myxococcales bacterium]|nr:hypothetical protein [Myxococcales bacterium]